MFEISKEFTKNKKEGIKTENNNKMFKELNAKEKKAYNITSLIKYTKGALTKEEIEKIINTKITLTVSDEYNDEYAEQLEINLGEEQCFIKFVTSAKDFAFYITEREEELAHSCAGSEYTQYKVFPLIGNKLTIGTDTCIRYSYNGDTHITKEEHIEPNFDITGRYCVYGFTHHRSSFNNDDIDEIYHEIVVYCGNESSYEVEDSIKQILHLFDL